MNTAVQRCSGEVKQTHLCLTLLEHHIRLPPE